jgi:hypothetical protein
MFGHETVKIELDSLTARKLEIWYETVKDSLLFNNIGEFLLATSRGYMKPYFKNIPQEKAQELDEIFERTRMRARAEQLVVYLNTARGT